MCLQKVISVLKVKVHWAEARIHIRTQMSRIHNICGNVNSLNQLFLRFTFCVRAYTVFHVNWQRFYTLPWTLTENIGIIILKMIVMSWKSETTFQYCWRVRSNFKLVLLLIGLTHIFFCQKPELEFLRSLWARNRGGRGLSYRPARLHRLAEFIPWNRFLGSINI
jgi:hypothetical protein